MISGEQNRQVSDRLRASIAEFTAGQLDLDEIQSALQSAISLFENDGSGIVNQLRLTEADIEEIRFTRLLNEQRAAVIFRLDDLAAELPELSSG